jgi:regulator-associated protein of mTOR
MRSDPYPEVAKLASTVVDFFVSAIDSFDILRQKHIQHQMEIYGYTRLPRIDQRTIQIKTDFVSWCCKYFQKPLLNVEPTKQSETIDNLFRINDQIDIFKADFLQNQCKFLYNNKLKRKVLKSWNEPQSMNESLVIKHNTQSVQCKFNPYDDHLFVVDKDCMINIYDIQNRTDIKKKTSFSILKNNYSNKMPVVTSFKLINAQYEPIFLTGTHDRVVRLFKPDLVNFTNNQFITAFKAFDNGQIRESNIEVGLIEEWDEPSEKLLCAGDTGYIRVWDMSKELYTDYPTQVKSCVSTLSCYDNLALAGFGDGTIKIFDFRQPTSTLSKVLYTYDMFVLKAKIHKPSNTLITSSISGDVKIFDMRSMKSSLNISSKNSESTTVFECHPYNQVYAVANEAVKVFDFRGKELTSITHHEGFLGKRIAPVSCLDWNHFKNEIVFGCQDNLLNIFSCKDK